MTLKTSLNKFIIIIFIKQQLLNLYLKDFKMKPAKIK